MTISPTTSNAVPSALRKRKAHTKSRRGCSSCKTRRVKCDESKPACQQCKGKSSFVMVLFANHTYTSTHAEFGVSCTYGGKATGLTFAGESSFDLNESYASRPELPSTTTCAVAMDASHLSDCQRPSLSSTVVAHCDGLANPPDFDREESGFNSMLGIAALEVMNRFNQRTVLSVGTTRAAEVYQKEVFRLACSVSNSINPFVRQINLIVFSIHS
jgi:hypothetical protein